MLKLFAVVVVGAVVANLVSESVIEWDKKDKARRTIYSDMIIQCTLNPYDRWGGIGLRINKTQGKLCKEILNKMHWDIAMDLQKNQSKQ